MSASGAKMYFSASVHRGQSGGGGVAGTSMDDTGVVRFCVL